MPVTGTSPDGAIAAPDYDQINLGNTVALVDAIRLTWNSLQAEVTSRKQQQLTWTDMPYSQMSFAAKSDTWTVSPADVLAYKYVVANDFLIIQFNFVNTATGANPGNELRFNLPAGYNATLYSAFTGAGHTFGAIDEPFFIVIQDSSHLNTVSLQRTGEVNWPGGVGNIVVRGFFALQIQT